jgi:uncharacterized protein
MELTSQQTLPVPQPTAWEALNDTAMLQAAMPGCESIAPTGEHQYDVVVLAAVGPVKARFKGKLRMDEVNAPHSYTIHFEAQGGAAGHGKGNATVRLEPNGPHETILHYTAHASVGGKLAQIGSRLVDMAAQKLATEFFENFNQALKDKYGEPEATQAQGYDLPEAPKGVIARLLAWLRRWMGLRSTP